MSSFEFYSFDRQSDHPFDRDRWLIGWLVGSFVHSFARSLVHSFVRSFVRTFALSLARSLVLSLVSSLDRCLFGLFCSFSRFLFFSSSHFSLFHLFVGLCSFLSLSIFPFVRSFINCFFLLLILSFFHIFLLSFSLFVCVFKLTGLKAMRDSFWYYIVITAAICISFTRVGVKPGIMSTIFFRCVFNISAFVRKF